MIESYKRKPPKPIQPQATFLVTNYIDTLCTVSKPIIDIACGYGRNGFEFVKQGKRVVFLDYDEDCLEAISNSKNEYKQNSNCIKTLKWNLSSGKLPFPNGSVSGVINIHYYNSNLIDEIIRVLQPGGFFCFETISGRTEHISGLPEYGFLKHKLNNFNFLYFKERLIKDSPNGASVCKLLAIKKTDQTNYRTFHIGSL